MVIVAMAAAIVGPQLFKQIDGTRVRAERVTLSGMLRLAPERAFLSRCRVVFDFSGSQLTRRCGSEEISRTFEYLAFEQQQVVVTLDGKYEPEVVEVREQGQRRRLIFESGQPVWHDPD